MVFVTGGTGLLGSHLLAELVQQHDQITAIYRHKAKIDTVLQCFNFYFKENAENHFNKIRWEACDILDVPRLQELMEGHKIVYHCAGFVSFARKDFSKLIEINRYGTANVVNVSLAIGVDKFCHVSSTSAVGNKDIPVDEHINEEGKWVKTDETSGYSIAKYSAENEVWRGINEGLNAVIVNPSVIFGAGDWDESSMVIFKTIDKGLKFYPPGINSFVDARDVAKIMVELMTQQIFNERFLCIGGNYAFKEVFDMIASNMEKKKPSIRLNKTLMGIAWRASSLFAALTFSKPAVSRVTARSAFNVSKFSNQKIKNAIGYEFFDLEETVKNALAGRIKK